MTEIIINGKKTTPTRHTITGCTIVGVEQVDDTITKLILEDNHKHCKKEETVICKDCGSKIVIRSIRS